MFDSLIARELTTAPMPMDVQTSLSSHWRCDVVSAGRWCGNNGVCQWEQTCLSESTL